MRLSCFRTLSVVLVITLSIMLAVPPAAEADPMTALAIAGAVVVVVILVAYLVVANMSDSRRAGAEHAVWLACAGDECRPIAQVAALPGPLPDRTQGP